jgi:hypothetical protein
MLVILVQFPSKFFNNMNKGTWTKNAHMSDWQLYLVPHLIWGHWVYKHRIASAIEQVHYSVRYLSPKIGMDIASMYHFLADSRIIWLSLSTILFCLGV